MMDEHSVEKLVVIIRENEELRRRVVGLETTVEKLKNILDMSNRGY